MTTESATPLTGLERNIGVAAHVAQEQQAMAPLRDRLRPLLPATVLCQGPAKEVRTLYVIELRLRRESTGCM